ncbi:MAG: pseudouridine synthase [Luminiphilus sp.]|nr:pseudouridine synthase [Luminiphilus sp.]
MTDLNFPLSLCFRDDALVVVEKPPGMLVHRSGIDAMEKTFLLQTLRDQLGQAVFPVHRLDKPTSGLVIFALSSEIARALSQLFERGEVEKTYQAFVRGHSPQTLTINHPLRDEVDSKGRKIKGGTSRDAITRLQTLASWTVPEPVDRYPEARYSQVQLKPLTGRHRQLRRHMKHISHPMLGDVRYGKGTHNRFIEEHVDIKRLWLHATELAFRHPVTQEPLSITSATPEDFLRMKSWLDGFQ